MSIFYLEIAKKIKPIKKPTLPSTFGLIETFSYISERVYLKVFVNTSEAKPTILENDECLLYVHGRSSNLNFDNYLEINCLYGNFNIIFINKKNNTIRFLKDFSNSFDSFLFSTNEKIIITNNPLLISKKGLRLDYLAISQYLLQLTGFFPLNYFFVDISKIKPGSVMTIEQDLSVNTKEQVPFREEITFGSFQNAFNEIVIRSIGNEVPGGISVDLTGGYDTRLITACLLKNNIDFIPVVHGEDDEEVKFVKKIAKELNIKLRVLKIGDHIDSIIKDWERYFFLSGGYYDSFEVLKEGARSTLRSHFSNYKVGGSMGEVLRDKWYSNKLHRSRLNDVMLPGIISEKLLDTEDPYKFCSKQFCKFLDSYKKLFNRELFEFLENNKDLDLSQRYMEFVFYHYTQGWNGCLYNFHNNIISVIAPFMDNQFYLKCLNVRDEFRKNVSGMTKSINTFYPKFRTIAFFDGQRCTDVKGLNVLRILIKKYVTKKIRSKFPNYVGRDSYDRSVWLGKILKQENFRSIIEKKNEDFNFIISESQFNSLVSKGLNNKLNKAEHCVLWKLCSLKLSLEHEFV